MLSLDKNKKYLLACSFGPDSMALFKMLLNEKFNFEVAHVNYHLRDEADDETRSLTEFCRENKIKLHILQVEKGSIKRNIEENCREIRYDYFKSLIKDFDALLIAHNQDDLIETYLLQKNRKSIVSYYGLREKNDFDGMVIIRPLLNYKKDELKQFCVSENVPFAIDKSNLEDKFLRNKIRHEIVSKLNDEERKDYIQKIDADNENLEDTKKKIEGLNIENIGVLRGFSDFELAIAIHYLARKVNPKIEISKRQIAEIKKILDSEKPNISLAISDVLLVKEYDRICFKSFDNFDGYSYEIIEPSELDTKYFYLNFINGAEDRNVHEDDYPLKIRNAVPTDIIKIKNYYKTFRRLAIDWKIPKDLRKKWPVILNKFDEIIYIPRYRNTFEIKENCNFYVKGNK